MYGVLFPARLEQCTGQPTITGYFCDTCGEASCARRGWFPKIRAAKQHPAVSRATKRVKKDKANGLTRRPRAREQTSLVPQRPRELGEIQIRIINRSKEQGERTPSGGTYSADRSQTPQATKVHGSLRGQHVAAGDSNGSTTARAIAAQRTEFRAVGESTAVGLSARTTD